MISKRARSAAVGGILASALAVSGCTATVPMRAADDATNPACASVIVALRDLTEIDGNEKRNTDAQATSAWGSPATILLTCGVPVPAPSTQRCVTVEGVDWLIDDSDEARGVFTTYGRDPAVQVVVDAETSESIVLNDLADAIRVNDPTRACTTPEDATLGEDPLIEGG